MKKNVIRFMVKGDSDPWSMEMGMYYVEKERVRERERADRADLVVARRRMGAGRSRLGKSRNKLQQQEGNLKKKKP
jgi:hypothetical protein